MHALHWWAGWLVSREFAHGVGFLLLLEILQLLRNLWVILFLLPVNLCQSLLLSKAAIAAIILFSCSLLFFFAGLSAVQLPDSNVMLPKSAKVNSEEGWQLFWHVSLQT
jgi:hypothetical protein